MTRTKMKDERVSVIKRFSVDGNDGYVCIGLFEDGTPGEVFVKMNKMGSTISGMLECWGIMVSLALQHGVPVSKIVEKMRHQQFEPYGFTGDSEIPQCRSVVDFIAQFMDNRFCDDGD